jgi:hypothetical protein
VRAVSTRRQRAFVLFIVVLAGLTAWSVTPATAAKPRASKAVSLAYCLELPGAAMFNSLTRLASSNTARSTDGRSEKNTSAITSDSNIPSGEASATSTSFRATIPVYFHVITDGSTGYLSKATVKAQINVLNRAYAGGYGGVNTGFQFTLKQTTYTDNAAWFAQETFAAEVAMKEALQAGDATTLNLYSTSGGGFLGWAYYPKIVTSQKYDVLDGTLIHYGSVPGGPITNFNLGHTATHEVGHWLGLAHTFEQGCQGHGDYVDDTPAMSIPTSGCPSGKDTCPEPGLDPIHNYMDYSYDTCYNQFTAGQAARMQQQWLHWRVKHGYHD